MSSAVLHLLYCVHPCPIILKDHRTSLESLFHSKYLLSSSELNRGFLSLLLQEGDGGHRRHHVMSLLAIVGGEQVRSAELPGQRVEEQAVEEGVVLLAPGPEAQHLRQQLRRLLSGEGREAEQLLYLLDAGQLIRSQQAAAKLRVGFAGSGSASTRSAMRLSVASGRACRQL